MRAWIGCLACYNNGSLKGDWFDALEAGDVTVEQVHGGKPCRYEGDELWVMESEDIGDGEMSPSEAQKRAEILSECQNPEALIAYYDYVGGTLEDCAARFEDAFRGKWENGEEFAEHLAEDTGSIATATHWPLTCIDWSQAWYELSLGDYFSMHCPGGGVFIFEHT